MEQRRRARRFVKWAGLVLCVMVSAGWAVSLMRCVGVGWDKYRVSLGDGNLCLWELRTRGRVFEGWHVYSEAPWGRRSYGLTWVHRDFIKDGGTRLLYIPLWLPFLLLAIPAVVFWRQDLRRPDSCCCGYDLTGNVSGRCPECGRVVAQSPRVRMSGRAPDD
jgi:hypothetical protein